MRAATHGCNEGSIEAGWLGQSHLPVMLNYIPTADEDEDNNQLHSRGGGWLRRRATACQSRLNERNNQLRSHAAAA